MDALLRFGLGAGLIALVAAALLSALLVPPGIRLAWRLGIVDRPVGDKIHARTTPLMGGVAVAIAFLAVVSAWQIALAVAPHPHHAAHETTNVALIGLIVGCVLAALLGVCDEVWSLSPRIHFLGQVGVVLVAVVAGFPVITTVSNPFQPTSLHPNGSLAIPTVVGLLFTLFWIVGMMNTVNFLDGLDGLAGGVSAIAALFLGLWAVASQYSGFPPTRDEQNVILPLILCGAILGFLVFNWAPARVFMGDSGAMFIGFALGALSIFGPVKLGTALLLLIVPIVDVAWAIVRRLLGRRSFASGDKHHIYHRLLELGLSRRRVVLLFYALCLALGVIDLGLYKAQKVIAIVVVTVLAAAGAVALEVRGRRAARKHLPAISHQPSAVSNKRSAPK